jgi:hypothetical protein
LRDCIEYNYFDTRSLKIPESGNNLSVDVDCSDSSEAEWADPDQN